MALGPRSYAFPVLIDAGCWDSTTDLLTRSAISKALRNRFAQSY